MTDGQVAPADVAGRIAAQTAVAAALAEVEGHPAHQQLVTPTLTGSTAQRWTRGKEQLARLWADFGMYQAVFARRVVANRITGTEEEV